VPVDTRTIDEIIETSTDYAALEIHKDGGFITLYAPMTSFDGRTWIHPTYAKDLSFEEVSRRAVRIWRIRGSFWNVSGLQLIWSRDPIIRSAA